MLATLERRKRKYDVFDYANIMLMALFALVIIFPFLNILALSLDNGVDAEKGGIYLWPRMFSLANYAFLLKSGDMWNSLLISIARVVVSTITGVFCTGLLAYLVTVKGFSGRKFMRVLFLFTMYFGGGLIPTYLVMGQLHLIESFNVYWIPGLLNAYYMLIIAAFMQGLPDSLMEAARIDGCSELGVFMRVALPVSMPAFAAIAVFTGVANWNSWFDVTLYNPSGHFDTMSVYLQKMLLQSQALQNITNTEELYHKLLSVTPLTLRAATTMLVTIPIACIYPFFQRYFIGGVTLGSVKE